MVTAGTLGREHRFDTPERLDLLHDTLLHLAEEHELRLHAWAVLSNHYHFIAECPESDRLGEMVRHLHNSTARELNLVDRAPGRQVWFQYWDSRITFQRSWIARLNYVHNNAVKHGRVGVATEYRWCSAMWFRQTARPSFVKTVESIKTDRISVVDSFD